MPASQPAANATTAIPTKPKTSDLTGFARALDFKGEDELHRVACNDSAELTRRYVKGKSPSPRPQGTSARSP
jgi:hypothetical protein